MHSGTMRMEILISIHSYAAIEQTLDGVLECGAVPISIGGDHAITLGELRAIAKKHGKVDRKSVV